MAIGQAAGTAAAMAASSGRQPRPVLARQSPDLVEIDVPVGFDVVGDAAVVRT
ncbi:MAG: hypothetical protein HYU43_03470, partial [Armatimonadetes bacterium]|nr:hypothetical protein [Armatimonadota bacterium]